MRLKLHLPSFLAGAGLAAGALLVASVSPPQGGTAKTEYKIVTDAEAEDIGRLAKEGWEYVGYLGTSKRGASIDEVLWRK